MDPFSEFATTKTIVIDQISDPLESCCKMCGCCCVDMTNIYNIVLPQGVRMQAKEHSGKFSRCCCNPNHELQLGLKTFDGNHLGEKEILQIFKPFKCCCPAVCPCCRKEITVSKTIPEHEVIGFVQQPWCAGIFTPKLSIFEKEGDEEKIGEVVGPCCCIAGCCSSDFEVNDNKGQKIATIKRQGAAKNGLRRALLSDADKYNINFENENESINMKLTIASSVMMLDYMFFEGETPFECNFCRCPPYCSFKLCEWYCCGGTIPCRVNCCVPNEPEK